MRLFCLTTLALIAFAANSVLNRAALADFGTDPAAFMGLRVIAGAITLAILAGLTAGWSSLRAGSWVSAAALLLYAVAFSFAYLGLDAGLGALILFGGVQLTMFAGAVLLGARPRPSHWIGSAMGMAGLSVLFLPGASAPPAGAAVLMLAAAIGWGIYSLRGAGVGPALPATAGNFLRAAPLAALIWLATGNGIDLPGAGLAVASGALASGLGYAIWYSVLPKIDASLAAIAQLTVPLIALSGGMCFLAEEPSLDFAIAAVLILSGVALAVLAPAIGRRSERNR